MAKILDENGPIAKRLRARIGKAVLWRLRTGRRRPELETAAVIAHLTHLAGRRIAEKSWIDPERWAELVKE